MIPILGYWEARGRAEPIRYLLHYSGTTFVDKRYPLAEEFGLRHPEWMNDKFNLGLEFPNLPYYMDEEVKLSQSIAILRYLGRKHGLAPDTTDSQQIARADIMEQQCVDFFNGLRTLAYNPNFTTEKVEYIKKLPYKIQLFENALGNNSWLLGQKITYVDFFLFEVLDRHRYLDPNFLNTFPKVKAYVDRFECLPNVAKYRESEEFLSIQTRMFGIAAKFGGSK